MLLALSLGSPNRHAGTQSLLLSDRIIVFTLVDPSWCLSFFVLNMCLLLPLVTLQLCVQKYPLGSSFVR